MFFEYFSELIDAKEKESKIIEKYNSAKMDLNIRIKLTMNVEIVKMESADLYTYSPIENYNKMTELVSQFEKLDKEYLLGMTECRKELNQKIDKLCQI